MDHRRLLIVDLSVNPAVYRPVDHWRPHVEALGVPVDVCRPPDGDAVADLAPYSHASLTGSEASILADTEWIVRACELTRQLDARHVKLLGSCFGHQLLARALSGPAFVRRTRGSAWGIQPHPEVGVDEGQALQASYLETMSARRDVLEGGWHAKPRDDRIAPTLVRGFLNA